MRPDDNSFNPVSPVQHRSNFDPDLGHNPSNYSAPSAAASPTSVASGGQGGHHAHVLSDGYSSSITSHQGDEDEDEDQDTTMESGSEATPPLHHQLHVQTYPPEPLHLYDDLDIYTSDEGDFTEDGGAPLESLFGPLAQNSLDNLPSPSYDDDFSEADHPENHWDAFASFLYGSVTPFEGPNWPSVDPAGMAAEWAIPHGQALDDDDDDDDDLAPGGFMNAGGVLANDDFFAFSTPNHHTLNPGNLSLHQFMEEWALHSRHFQLSNSRAKGRFPDPLKVAEQVGSRVMDCIRYDNLEGDKCDVQGINWEDLGVSRSLARAQRSHTYKNYVNKHGSDHFNPRLVSMVPTPDESFFRFKQMNIRRNVHLAHFQLRNVLASTSRDRVFYTSASAVHQLSPLTGQSKIALQFESGHQAQITSLAADYGLLVAGSFNGRYCIRNFNSEFIDGQNDLHEGTVTSDVSGITNHVQLHIPRRSSTPHAAFASNDLTFRGLDLATETFLHETKFRFALNCTAVSPDGRLRVMVGDHTNVFITAAEPERHTGNKPDILCELEGHKDYGFACDWADDGYTVATGFQDRFVKIWDARRWTDSSGKASPVCTIRTELAGARCLKFSPVGSGRRVLVAAEEADFVNIIDAQTFAAKQTFDIFGELGGVAFANGGQDLYALSCDPWRGGVIRLERCGAGFEAVHNDDVFSYGGGSAMGMAPSDLRWDRGMDFDWPAQVSESSRAEEWRRRVRARRRVREAAVADLKPF